MQKPTEMSNRAREHVVALVEAILAFIALTAVAVLGVRPIVAGICIGNWRFLGMSPIILVAAISTVTLLLLMLTVIFHLSVKVASTIKLRSKVAEMAIALALMLTPMSLSYLIVASFSTGAITDDPIDMCAWAAAA